MNLFSGNVNEDLTFEYGDGTHAFQGCGVTLKDQFWYFGGGTSTASNYVRIVEHLNKLDRYLYYLR